MPAVLKYCSSHFGYTVVTLREMIEYSCVHHLGELAENKAFVL